MLWPRASTITTPLTLTMLLDSTGCRSSNNTMRTSRITAIALLLLTGVMVGCSAPRTGSPSPETTDTATGSSVSTQPSSSASSDLAQRDPCSLINPSEGAQVGINGPGKRSNVAGGPGCQWQVSGSFVATVDLFPNKGLGDLNSSNGTATSTQVGHHQARQLQKTDSGRCDIDLA